MHDPMTVAFDCKIPWGWHTSGKGARFRNHIYLFTIWHVDPERGGDDDSCQWFDRTGSRPWWKHPRWHFWHWKIQIHAVQNFKRWLFSRCAGCGKGFKWGYAPTSTSWHGHGPRWFRGESHTYHHDCVPRVEHPPAVETPRTSTAN